jgi:hypothetical protein
VVNDFGRAKQRTQTAEADESAVGLVDGNPTAEAMVLPMSGHAIDCFCGFCAAGGFAVADVFDDIGIAE